MLDAVKFAAIVFCALAMVPAGAHLMELLNKIHMPAESYLVAQQLYRGWALAAVLVIGALVSTLALVFLLRGRPGFIAAVIAFLCIVGTQAIFWSATYPANSATQNWTVLPERWERWERLRTQWEYSHAVSAVLNLAALMATTIAVIRSNEASLS